MTTPARPHALLYGERIGGWRLLERVGSGTFGVILRARRMAEPGPLAALKIAREPMDPRFEREAEVLSRCRSPHLHQLLDRGVWRSEEGPLYPYLVMQWVEGVPLYMWAKQQGLTNATATRVLAHIALALAEVHKRGGLHRDVKGDNVLVGPDGFAVLVDLGVATTTQALPLTEAGRLPPGTPQYRAPEALRFERVGGARYEATPADDVYALGVTAYRLVTGTYPPPGTSSWSGGEVRKRVPPSELASVCPELERLILRMLSKEPAARRSAEESARSLEALLASGAPSLAGAIVPTAAMMPTVRTERPGPRHARALPAWLGWMGSSVLGALLTLGAWSLFSPATRLHEPSGEWGHRQAGEEVGPKEAPSGLADGGVEVLWSAATDTPSAGVPTRTVSLPMPKQPLPGQRKPPCEPRLEQAIHGACWVVVGEEKPPCGPKMFDHEGRCYIPSTNLPRQPTSGEP